VTSARKIAVFTRRQESKTQGTAGLFKNMNEVRTRAMSKRQVIPRYKHSNVDGRNDRRCSK
jgi:hypothetical protein